MSSNLHLVFFGNGEDSLIILKAILTCCTPDVGPNPESELSVEERRFISKLEIVTSSNLTIVSKYCKSISVPFLLWGDISSSQFANADIGVITGFGKMLPEDLITVFKRGIINVHPSLIPRWRGGSPVIYSILHSDTGVGVTILQTSAKKFDNGNIILQNRIEIDPFTHDRISLSTLLISHGATMLLEVLKNIELYQSQSFAQPTVGITVAKKISKQLTEINWHRQMSKDIDTVYRAAGDMFPLHSHFIDSKGESLPVELFEPLPSSRFLTAVKDRLEKVTDAKAGSVQSFKRNSDNKFYVRCADDWVGFGAIRIGRQQNRRNRLNAQDFWAGYLRELLPNAIAFCRDVPPGNIV